MFRASADAQEWAVMLRTELSSWPKVRMRPMFGMMGVYRGTKIFACLPTTRTLGWSPNSFLFKFSKASALLERQIAADANLRRGRSGALGWTSFELKSHEQMGELLRWFERAYESAL
jgi:hypothetical protein